MNRKHDTKWSFPLEDNGKTPTLPTKNGDTSLPEVPAVPPPDVATHSFPLEDNGISDAEKAKQFLKGIL